MIKKKKKVRISFFMYDRYFKIRYSSQIPTVYFITLLDAKV